MSIASLHTASHPNNEPLLIQSKPPAEPSPGLLASMKSHMTPGKIGSAVAGGAVGSFALYELYKRSEPGQISYWNSEFRKHKHFKIAQDEQGLGGTRWLRQMQEYLTLTRDHAKAVFEESRPVQRLILATDLMFVLSLLNDEHAREDIYHHFADSVPKEKREAFLKRMDTKVKQLAQDLYTHFPENGRERKAVDSQVEKMLENRKRILVLRQKNRDEEDIIVEQMQKAEDMMKNNYNAELTEEDLTDAIMTRMEAREHQEDEDDTDEPEDTEEDSDDEADEDENEDDDEDEDEEDEDLEEEHEEDEDPKE